jgi:septation ring formation regulator EzrA
MRLRLDPHDPLARGIRRVARKEADVALAIVAHAHPLSEPHVHALRKSLKRLRALMKLIEDPRRKRLRRSSAALAPLRDVDVVRSTLKTLVSEEPRLMPAHTLTEVKRQLRHLHQERVKACKDERTIRKVEKAVRDAASRLAEWRPAARGFASCRPGLVRAHRRCRRALVRAASSRLDVDFHEWRKRLSVVRDHLALIAPPGSEMQAEALALDRAVTSLGDDHNLVVLRDILERLSTEQRAVIDLSRLHRSVAKRQRQLHQDALTGASETCLRDSDDYANRIEAAWKRARQRRR